VFVKDMSFGTGMFVLDLQCFWNIPGESLVGILCWHSAEVL